MEEILTMIQTSALTSVNKLKGLGIYLSANPADMEGNFDGKTNEIESLLRRWNFSFWRNILG